MEIPVEVMVHSPAFGLKGNRCTLIRISPDGFYEVNLPFGESTHRTLLPIDGTMVIQQAAEISLDDGLQLER
jgi:hypothetical protein